jgi:hypothetical protein
MARQLAACEGSQAWQIQQSASTAADRLRTANAWILGEIPTRRRFDAAGDSASAAFQWIAALLEAWDRTQLG